MKGKILFVTGLGVGYVLGTRAGRERYESIKSSFLRLWNDPKVQRQVDAAESFVKDKAPDVAEFVTDNAKKVVSQVTSRNNSAASKARTSSRTTAARSAGSTSGTAKSS